LIFVAVIQMILRALGFPRDIALYVLGPMLDDVTLATCYAAASGCKLNAEFTRRAARLGLWQLCGDHRRALARGAAEGGFMDKWLEYRTQDDSADMLNQGWGHHTIWVMEFKNGKMSPAQSFKWLMARARTEMFTSDIPRWSGVVMIIEAAQTLGYDHVKAVIRWYGRSGFILSWVLMHDNADLFEWYHGLYDADLDIEKLILNAGPNIYEWYRELKHKNLNINHK
jgi:hypothetical protein